MLAGPPLCPVGYAPLKPRALAVPIRVLVFNSSALAEVAMWVDGQPLPGPEVKLANTGRSGSAPVPFLTAMWEVIPTPTPHPCPLWSVVSATISLLPSVSEEKEP